MKRYIGLLFLLLLAIPASAQMPSVTLDWTSPGDDGNIGTASVYEMRWRNARPDTTSQATILTWWNAATAVSGLPAPAVAGTTQSVVVAPTGGFLPGTYYFVMRAGDEVPNWSLFSNVVTLIALDTAPPSRILDLRMR